MKRRGRRSTALASSPLSYLGGLLALYLLGPILYFVVKCRGNGDLGFGADGLSGAVRTSVISATLSTAIVLVLGVPLARVLARSRGWFARLVGLGVQLPLALPPVMSGIVLIYLVGPYTWAGEHLPLTDSLAGVVVAQTFVAAPFLVIAARSAFSAIDPDVDDLAATLGVGPLGRFWRVDLPLALPGIVAGALLTWLRALGEYGATSLIAYHPSTLPVYTSVQFAGSGLTATSAPTLLALALAVVVLVVTSLPRLRPRRAPRLPEPVAPPRSVPTPVAFDVDHTAGTFTLRAAHAATSHRLAVLGPSGAGKSLLLKSLAGLVEAQEVRFGADDVTAAPTEDRCVGYVPQNRLLFTHRSVWQNVTFSPRAVPARAAWWLAELRLTHLAPRQPRGLSGGERQRASVVQALAGDARLLLLDEPFSALDTPTRHALVRRLRALQQQENLSSVLVTHDPEEARLLADEIVLLEGGRIIQAGTTREVFSRPASLRAARLVGMVNVLPARCAVDDELVLAEGITVSAPGARASQAYLAHLPGEALRLEPSGHPVPVVDVVDAGTHYDVRVDLGGHEVEIRSEARPPSRWAGLRVDAAGVQWWPILAELH